MQVPVDNITSCFPKLLERNVELHIKREELLHPHISGNKFRKLKYNLLHLKEKGLDSLLTFGGAFSNHIAATAYAGKKHGIRTLGVIRGEELQGKPYNATLAFASACGMEFHFVDRETYRLKNQGDFIDKLRELYGDFYLLPEGGSNELAVKGCEEILTPEDAKFTHIALAVGTGGTLSGIIRSALPGQKVLGFPALKGDFLQKDICKFTDKSGWELILEYHFGGYAKIGAELVHFMNDFRDKTGILLDPIYTAKMAYGVLDRMDDFTPGSKILMIHTGGLQAIQGMNAYLKKKNLPLIRE